jgi:hypothetical protein
MYIAASFRHSLFLELAISEIIEAGIKADQILTIPLDRRNEKMKIFDNMHQADGVSFLDLSLILGTIFMLLGSIYGFILPLGPILWALFGLVIGSLLGFLIKIAILKRNHSKEEQHRTGNNKVTEVFLMVKCSEEYQKEIESILWNHHAYGVGRL